MTSGPQVSVIIPCRNEVKYLGPCLDSLLISDYPKEQLEVLIVDGMSDDGTRAIAQRYVERHARIRLLDNVQRITPTALNIGIRAARGDIIVRLDAHVLYPSDYIIRSVTALEESGADNVGGVIITLAGDDTAVARGIATVLAHPFGVGNSHFRIGAAEPRWVDTVPFGCYRRDVFDRVGLFDEQLPRDQDDEFNQRLLRRGGRLLLVPAITAKYYARESMGKVARMFFQYGYFKPLVVRKIGGVMTVRQLVPALFVSVVLVAACLAPWLRVGRLLLGLALGSYVAVDVIVAAAIARHGGLRVGFAASAIFPVLHCTYGLGYLRGILDFLVCGKRSATAVRLSR